MARGVLKYNAGTSGDVFKEPQMKERTGDYRTNFDVCKYWKAKGKGKKWREMGSFFQLAYVLRTIGMRQIL